MSSENDTAWGHPFFSMDVNIEVMKNLSVRDRASSEEMACSSCLAPAYVTSTKSVLGLGAFLGLPVFAIKRLLI
jgi:hypothetical protein